MGPSKNNRRLRKASYLIVSIFLLLGFSSFVLPTHGQPSNTGACLYLNTASSLSSYTFTISAPGVTYSGSCTFTANYLVVLVVQTYSSSATVSTITDNAGGNSYAQIAAVTNTIAETGFCATTNGIHTTMWFVNIGTSPITFTVNLAANAVINGMGDYIRVYTLIYNPSSAIYAKFDSTAAGSTLNGVATNGNPANTGTVTLSYGTKNIPKDSVVVGYSTISLGSCASVGAGTAVTTNSPLSSAFSNGQASAGFYIPTSSVQNQAFSAAAKFVSNTNCGSASGCSFQIPYDTVLGILSFQGNLPPNCGPNNQAGVVIGSSIRSASTAAITSNQTDLYVTTISSSGASILNISTRLSSVALTNGQTSAKLTLGLWLATNTNSINAQNPLTFQPLASFSWTIVNNANAQTFWIAPNFGVPASSTIAIGLGVSHAGANGYLTSDSGLNMQVDTADAFSSGKPPTSITVYTAAATPLFFGASAIENCSVSTVTGGSGGSATVTSTQVVIVNQSSPTQGPFWFIPLLFLFIFPAIFMAMGHTAKLEGAVMVYLIMLGLTLGSLIGNMAQVIPMGLTYLLSALTVILSWRLR